jgi:hypothetical protein
MAREIIITGGDSHFFPYLSAALNSLRSHAATAAKDYGIIDQGLTAEQKTQLSALGCRIVRPEWTLPVPEQHRQLRNIGLVARTALRDYFPGYEVYLWFDADAWMQTPEFLSAYLDGARATGAAVALENGPGYRKSFVDLKWWTGNMLGAYGLAGVKLALVRSINIGVLCLTDTAPHWNAWIRAYSRALERMGKVNLDQHAFLAAIHLDKLATTLLPARYNWLPHLSRPIWNPVTQLLCEPVAPYRPLSVVHLAGPQKDRPYQLEQLGGGNLATRLTYPEMRKHFAAYSAVDDTVVAAW